jgi:hypothetical protein
MTDKPHHKACQKTYEYRFCIKVTDKSEYAEDKAHNSDYLTSARWLGNACLGLRARV